MVNSKISSLRNTQAKLNQKTSRNWIPFLNKNKDQGQCGSCWSFAAVTTIEGQYNYKFGKLYDFSEQYLVDCDNLDNGCNGGWPSNTFKWLSKNGVVEQKDAPYKAAKGVCEAQKLAAKEYKIVQNFTMYHNRNQPASEWYKLLDQGPVLVAMDASADGFSFYRPKTDQAWNPKKCGQLNHAVVAVGYESINGTDYLRVRNSWGVNWGINGNFLIRADNHCGVMQYGWLPGVYNGTTPNPNPAPIPPPAPVPVNPDVPIEDGCTRSYPKCGFQGNSSDICDSIVNLKQTVVSGLKFAANSTNVV